MSSHKRLPSTTWLGWTQEQVTACRGVPGQAAALPSGCVHRQPARAPLQTMGTRQGKDYGSKTLPPHGSALSAFAKSPPNQLISLKASLSLPATSNQPMLCNLCPQALSLQGKPQMCLACINYIYSNTHLGPRLKKYFKYLFGFTAFRSGMPASSVSCLP